MVERFLSGFILTFLGSIAWQLTLVLAASFIASSTTLRQHTRHQTDLAILLWIGGSVLHFIGFVLLIGRSRGNGTAGIWSAGLLLVGLVWFTYQLSEIAASLRD